jgi:MoaA/NifB/PqqE/SkfB family radical SAM enzyme
LLCKSNCALETIDLAIKSCADNGIEHIRFSIPQLQYSNRGLRGNLISKDKAGQIKEYIKKRAEGADAQTEIFFIDFLHEQAKDSFKGRILPCFSRWFYPTIGIDGYLYPCCQVATSEFKPLRISNLNEKSFWNSFYNYQYPDRSIPIAKLGCKCDRKSLVLNNIMQHSNS